MIQKAIDTLEREAARLEAWIKTKSPIYVQFEDMGHTMTRVRTLREAASILRDELHKSPET